MTPNIKRSHSASELVYHLVCPVKYRRKIFTDTNEETLKEICLELEKRYDLKFLEIGIDKDHVHFLVQSIPNMSPSDIANTVKGNIAIQFFKKHEEVKRFLWGGSLWTAGYYINTVGSASMNIIKNYVKNQGILEYKQIHLSQKTLFNS